MLNMNKESFVFYKSFYEAINNLSKEDQLEVYNAICEYSFNENIPETLTGVAKAMFILMKPNIDSANARYRASVENGKKGGRPKKKETQQKPNQNLDKTQQKPNQNLNDNVDDNVNDNVNYNIDNIYSPAKAEPHIPYKEITEYLNNRACTNYRHTTNKTKDLIKARFNEGFTLDNFKEVIDKKCVEWMNTDMEKYIRPETLFGTKFESYLNQQIKERKVTTKDLTIDISDF